MSIKKWCLTAISLIALLSLVACSHASSGETETIKLGLVGEENEE